MIDRITGTNGWLLGYLEDNSHRNVYQKDLEDAFCITRSTVSRVVDGLVKKGLIERQPVPEDARLKRLVLTPKATALTAMMREDGQKLEARLTAGFSREEIETLLQYLDRMKQNIEIGGTVIDP